MFCVRLPESWNQAFRQWQKEQKRQKENKEKQYKEYKELKNECLNAFPQEGRKKSKRKNKSKPCHKKPRLASLPEERLQLPLTLSGRHKGQDMELILWWIDNEDGYERTGRRRSNTIVEIHTVPDSMKEVQGQFVGTVTKSVSLLFDNTQSGWTAWKVKGMKPSLPLQRLRHKYGGPGFRNHPALSTWHRDYLMSLCRDREKYFVNDQTQIDVMLTTIPKHDMLGWLHSFLTTGQNPDLGSSCQIARHRPTDPTLHRRASPSAPNSDPMLTFLETLRTKEGARPSSVLQEGATL